MLKKEIKKYLKRALTEIKENIREELDKRGSYCSTYTIKGKNATYKVSLGNDIDDAQYIQSICIEKNNQQHIFEHKELPFNLKCDIQIIINYYEKTRKRELETERQLNKLEFLKETYK